nr:unnamed protein product [Callosobruchus analis]
MSLINTRGILSSVVMHIDDVLDLERNIQYFSQYEFWTPSISFLVIYTKLNPDKTGERIVKTMLQNKLIHTVVLTLDPGNQTSFNIYSWSFKKNRFCTISSMKHRKVGSCSFGIRVNSKSIKNRVRNCKLKVAYVQIPPFAIEQDGGVKGIEVEVLKLFADKMNLGLEFHDFNESRGTLTRNKATGLLKRLRDNEVDMLIGAFVKTAERCNYFDCSRSYNILGNFVWCVPKTHKSIGLSVMLFYIKLDVWIAFLLSYISLNLCLRLVSYLKCSESRYYSNLPQIFFWSVGIMLEVGSNRQPSTWYGKYFFGILLCLGLYMSNIFNSEITSILTNSYTTEKYKRLEDVFTYNLDTYYRGPQWLIVDNETKTLGNVPAELVKQKWLQLENVTEGMLKIVEEHISYNVQEFEKEYVMSKEKALRKIKGRVTCLQDGSKNLQLTLLIRKGLFVKVPFDVYLLRLTDHGFFIKWSRSLVNTYNTRLSDIDEDKIRFQHIKSVFIILAIGHTLTVIVFVLEVFENSKNKSGTKNVSKISNKGRLEKLSELTEP